MVEDLNNLSLLYLQRTTAGGGVQPPVERDSAQKEISILGYGGGVQWYWLCLYVVFWRQSAGRTGGGGGWCADSRGADSDGAAAHQWIFINLICSFIVTMLALLVVQYQLADHSDKIIIGTLMSLVPGVAITNSIRDVIAGDLMAGMMKAVEALLIALALALGTGMALIAMGGI